MTNHKNRNHRMRRLWLSLLLLIVSSWSYGWRGRYDYIDMHTVAPDNNSQQGEKTHEIIMVRQQQQPIPGNYNVHDEKQQQEHQQGCNGEGCPHTIDSILEEFDEVILPFPGDDYDDYDHAGVWDDDEEEEEEEDEDTLEDEHHMCEKWAGGGECDVNPNYMLQFCQRSCYEYYRRC